jgi:hypothetical protein
VYRRWTTGPGPTKAATPAVAVRQPGLKPATPPRPRARHPPGATCPGNQPSDPGRQRRSGPDEVRARHSPPRHSGTTEGAALVRWALIPGDVLLLAAPGSAAAHEAEGGPGRARPSGRSRLGHRRSFAPGPHRRPFGQLGGDQAAPALNRTRRRAHRRLRRPRPRLGPARGVADQRRSRHRTRRLVHQLEQLGHTVTLGSTG